MLCCNDKENDIIISKSSQLQSHHNFKVIIISKSSQSSPLTLSPCQPLTLSLTHGGQCHSSMETTPPLQSAFRGKTSTAGAWAWASTTHGHPLRPTNHQEKQVPVQGTLRQPSQGRTSSPSLHRIPLQHDLLLQLGRRGAIGTHHALRTGLCLQVH